MAGINNAAALAHSGQLPVVEVIEGYYSKQELQTYRGWNPYLVRKFLRPDRIRKVVAIWENPSKNWEKELLLRYYEFEYCKKQVAAVEATPEWQRAKSRSERKDRKRAGF